MIILYFVRVIFFFKNVYLFLREKQRQRQSVSRRRAERETESKAGSKLQAVDIEPDTGLKPTNREMLT